LRYCGFAQFAEVPYGLTAPGGLAEVFVRYVARIGR
jgi:hypothetical protein